MSKKWKHTEEPGGTQPEKQVGSWQVPKEEKGGWKKELLEWENELSEQQKKVNAQKTQN